MRELLCACTLLFASACATTNKPPDRTWSSTKDQDHPLAGRIWDVRTGRFVELPALQQAVREARFVLLGETHDNADHHLLQAELVRTIAVSGRRPALAFEMLDVGQQAKVDAALAAAPADPDAIAEAVEWAKSGWPEFALYRPIFAAGLEGGLKLIAANLPRAQVRAAVREGPSALDAAVRARIEQEGPYPAALLEAMRQEMAEAHCGHLPEGMLEPLVLAQRARDVQMAQRVLSSDEGEGAILIAGTGHVRADSGVPALLRKDAPHSKVVSVAFLEVSPQMTTPQAYAERWRGALPFDFVVFTPSAERKDPCEAFRKKK